MVSKRYFLLDRELRSQIFGVSNGLRVSTSDAYTRAICRVW